jgi:hypothetical protein
MKLDYLVCAGLMNFVASTLHIAIIFGGASWYRFFGAGEAMAQMAEQNLLRPTLITFSIAIVLAIWGAYAWSGAGLILKLPLLKIALIAITAVYVVRGLVGLAAPFVSEHPDVVQNSTSFWIWSSLICLLVGVMHLKGVIDRWSII